MPSKRPKTEEEWLACLPLPEYLEIIPIGQIRPIVGPIIWVDGNGNHLSSAAYLHKHGVDPQTAWDAIKEYRRRNGPGVHAVTD